MADPASVWDEEYRSGRYLGEPCVGFVRRIMQTLAKNPRIRAGRGLYVGCGSGRNYIPLADSGLDIAGIDISPVAIRMLSERAPGLADRVACADFARYESGMFDYIVSIQAFQHGTQKETARYFAKTLDILRPGGMLFLRVNSSSTDVWPGHTVTEKSGSGGFTVRYEEGPKKDLDIRFYSLADIEELCGGLGIVYSAEDRTVRAPPGRGAWSQWDVILG